MIGIVVVSHGKLARELVAATEHVVGPQEFFQAISIEADDDMEARREQIIETAKACDQGKGVIILTDMFGGTPSNLAIATRARFETVEVVTGANLPMLVKLAKSRALDRREAWCPCRSRSGCRRDSRRARGRRVRVCAWQRCSRPRPGRCQVAATFRPGSNRATELSAARRRPLPRRLEVL